MTELRLRPRSVTEIVDAAFALYRRNAMQYILVVALAYTPSLVFQLIYRTDLVPSVGASMISLAISILTYSLMGAVVVKLGSTAYLGGEPDIAVTVREVMPRLLAVIAGTIMKAILFVLFMLLFIFPVFYAAARWFAVEQVIVLEGASSSAAFGRSSELSDGHKWHILLTLALAFFIYAVLLMGAFVVIGLTGQFVLILLGGTAVTVIVYPMIGLTQLVLYYDTRIRSEGFDLEQMAGALDAVPAGGGRGGING